jgi:hypothetical protein
MNADKKDPDRDNAEDGDEVQPHSLGAFENALQRLTQDHPKTVAALQKAQSNRRARLPQYAGGARLRGFEELLTHLEELKATYLSTKRLKPIAFLMERAHSDFVTALEAGLSGFEAVAHDAMRDVMEIEFLLRDFSNEPENIDDWLHCSSRERNNRYRPAVLRHREARRLGLQPKDLPEARDYKAHSELVHVFPSEHPMMSRGLVDTRQFFFGDAFFAEIFEHARRLLFVAHILRRKLAPHAKSPLGPWRGLKNVRDAWQRTRELQAIWLAILEASRGQQRSDQKPS